MTDLIERLRSHKMHINDIDLAAHEIERLRAENEKLRTAKAELLRLLDEALDGYADCIPYKGDYLIKKHGDEENFADLRAAAAALKETGDD